MDTLVTFECTLQYDQILELETLLLAIGLTRRMDQRTQDAIEALTNILDEAARSSKQ